MTRQISFGYLTYYVVVPKGVKMAPRDPAEAMVIELDVPITMVVTVVARRNIPS